MPKVSSKENGRKRWGGGGRCVEKGMGKAKELLKRERLWIYFFLSLKKGSVRERE